MLQKSNILIYITYKTCNKNDQSKKISIQNAIIKFLKRKLRAKLNLNACHLDIPPYTPVDGPSIDHSIIIEHTHIKHLHIHKPAGVEAL